VLAVVAMLALVATAVVFARRRRTASP
jgi:hypothetical protein